MNYPPKPTPTYRDSLLWLVNQFQFVRLIGGFVELKFYPRIDTYKKVIFGELLARVKSLDLDQEYPAVTLTEIQSLERGLILLGETPTTAKLFFSVAEGNDMIVIGTGYFAIVNPLNHNLQSLTKIAQTAEEQSTVLAKIESKPSRRRVKQS